MRSVLVVTLVAACGSSSPAKSPTSSAPPPRQEDVRAGTPVSNGTPRSGAVTTTGNRCDAVPLSDLSIDGLLDDWRDRHVIAQVGNAADGAVELRCAWDGSGIALVLDVKDDRVIRVKGGHEDHVSVTIAAGARPLAIEVYPGNSMAPPKIVKPARVTAADSLQPKGFSVEVLIPAAAIPDFSPSTPNLRLRAVFHDSDAAAGGDTRPIEIATAIELGDRKDLLDDFLATVHLHKTDLKLDTLVDLDPDRRGKERLVAGGTVIGVLTDQFAYVTLPAAAPSDVRKIELLPLGAKGVQVVSAIVRQTGNGGSRDLLMLWTVWSGQLQPLVNIEVRKELGANILETSWKIAKGKKAPELVVETKPAVGFTAQSYNEIPAGDADPILVPWDDKKTGIAYTLAGKEIERRELAVAKKPKRR